MAIVSKCTECDADVLHVPSEIPYCEAHSPRTAAKKAEAERWAKLTVEQKLDELKQRLDDRLEHGSHREVRF